MAAIALTFNLGLNWFLIPRYLHIGAAIATSLTELLLLGSSVLFTPKNLLPLKSLWIGGKILLACVAMAAVIWPLRNLDILLIIPLATIAYLISILLLRAIPREDIQALLQAIRNKTEASSTKETIADVPMSNIIPEIPIESIQLFDVTFDVTKVELSVEVSTGQVPTVKIPRITLSTGQVPRITLFTGEVPTMKIPRMASSIGKLPTLKLPSLSKKRYDSEVTR